MNVKNEFLYGWYDVLPTIFQYTTRHPRESKKLSDVCKIFREVIQRYTLPEQLSNYQNFRKLGTEHALFLAGFSGKYLKKLDFTLREINTPRDLKTKCPNLEELIVQKGYIANLHWTLPNFEENEFLTSLSKAFPTLRELEFKESYETDKFGVWSDNYSHCNIPTISKIIGPYLVQEMKLCDKIPQITSKRKGIRINSSDEEASIRERNIPYDIERICIEGIDYEWVEEMLHVVLKNETICKKLIHLQAPDFQSNDSTIVEAFKNSKHQLQSLSLNWVPKETLEKILSTNICQTLTSLELLNVDYNFNCETLNLIAKFLPLKSLKIKNLFFDPTLFKELTLNKDLLPNLEKLDFYFESDEYSNLYDDFYESRRDRISEKEINDSFWDFVDNNHDWLPVIEKLSRTRPDLFLDIVIDNIPIVKPTSGKAIFGMTQCPSTGKAIFPEKIKYDNDSRFLFSYKGNYEDNKKMSQRESTIVLENPKKIKVSHHD